MKKMVIPAVVIILLGLTNALAETDVFMRAVGFALTGSDNGDPKPVDLANCVFKLNDALFRLDNVETDRIEIQGWEQTSVYGTHRWVTVSLHSDEVIYETTTKPPLTDDGSEYMRQIKQSMPELFKSHLEISKEHVLELATADQDRVTRAWTYVYSHGCIGKKSPF